MIRKSLALYLTLLLSALSTSIAYAYSDSFSCSFGKQAACLDYGDKVCSSLSKCVSEDAICFDSYTCGHQGFVCKSKLVDLASEYDSLLNKCKSIASEHDTLTIEHDELLRKWISLVAEYEELESCISYASTLEEARNCY